jgi:hypothetical protein
MSEAAVFDEDREITNYVFVKGGYRHFAPQYVAVGATTVDWIFPVPNHNTVGTLDKLSNGIVFMKFGDYGTEPECMVVAKDYGDNVYDLFYYRFSTNYTYDMIAYLENRVAVIANTKTGAAFYVGCGLSRSDYLLGVRFFNPQEKLFVLVKSIIGNTHRRDSFLYITKLESQVFIDTGWSMYIGETDDDDISPHFPLYHTWQVHDRKLFVYDKEWKKIICTDGKQSVSHPFLEAFNANAKLFYIVKDIAIHPNLPFGVIIEENIYGTQDLVVLCWDIANPNKQDERVLSFGPILEELPPLFGLKRLTLVYQSFSPDGNWYVVGFVGRTEGNESRSPHFVAIPATPVDKKHPYFLDIDNLVILGQVAGLTSIAWASEPTSYVVSDGEILYRWDLDELPDARVFEIPEDGAGQKKASFFRKIGRYRPVES